MFSGYIVVKGLTTKCGRLRRGWATVMVDFPGWPLGNGANKSNDDGDEWNYDTMLTTR